MPVSNPSHIFNFNRYSKRIKIAYNRWQKHFNASNEVDEATLCCEIMMEISNQCKENSAMDFEDIVSTVYDGIYGKFLRNYERELKAAKNFAEYAYSPSEKDEAQQHLAEIEKKLVEKKKLFIKQMRSAFELFDFTITSDEKAILDYSKYKQLISELKKIGYDAFLVDDMQIMNAKTMGIGYYSTKKLSEGYNIVANGTFFDKELCGTALFSNGKSYESNNNRTEQRGCIVVQASGLISIDYSPSNQISSIREKFLIKKNDKYFYINELAVEDPAIAFMGGAVYLIKDYKPVSGNDIYYKQKFFQTTDGSDKGLKIEQLRATKHIVFGLWNSSLFLLIPSKKSGRDMQKDLPKFNFSDVLKFDGGNEFFFDSDKYGKHLKGKNSPSGFALKVVKL